MTIRCGQSLKLYLLSILNPVFLQSFSQMDYFLNLIHRAQLDIESQWEDTKKNPMSCLSNYSFPRKYHLVTFNFKKLQECMYFELDGLLFGRFFADFL